jgi:hypothetical protein
MVHADGNEARYGLLGYLAPAVPGENFESFCRESRTTILHHLSPPKEEDTDFLAELAREDGAESFQRLSVSCSLIFELCISNPISSEPFPNWRRSSPV